MGAAMIHDADPARTVAERDQLFAEQHQPDRIAVGLNSDDSSAGIQYCRNISPIGVPGPTRVSNSLSAAVVTIFSPQKHPLPRNLI